MPGTTAPVTWRVVHRCWSSMPTSASRAPSAPNRRTTARPRLPVAPVIRTRCPPSACIRERLQPVVLLLLEPRIGHEVPALAHLRLEVRAVVRVRLHHERDPPD